MGVTCLVRFSERCGSNTNKSAETVRSEIHPNRATSAIGVEYGFGDEFSIPSADRSMSLDQGGRLST